MIPIFGTLICTPGTAQIVAPTAFRVEQQKVDLQALEAAAQGPHAEVRVRFEMEISDRAHGVAIVLWNDDQDAKRLESFQGWDEPNIPGSFALAFDCHDPHATKIEGKPRIEWFDARGNFYNRPQHQVSVLGQRSNQVVSYRRC